MRKITLLFLFVGTLVGQRLGYAEQIVAQAQTPEEFDLYLEFHETLDAEARHRAALRFERVYPESQLLVYVYESELEYARSCNFYEAALSAGEKALRLAPNNIKVLVALAEILPNGTQDAAVLSKAAEHARRVLEQLKDLQLAPEASLQECENLRSFMGSRAHAALGYVAGKRGQLAVAIEEFNSAITLSPKPNGSQLFRLGKLYQASQRQREAVEMFLKAAKAGPAVITRLAEAELGMNK